MSLLDPNSKYNLQHLHSWVNILNTGQKVLSMTQWQRSVLKEHVVWGANPQKAGNLPPHADMTKYRAYLQSAVTKKKKKNKTWLRILALRFFWHFLVLAWASEPNTHPQLPALNWLAPGKQTLVSYTIGQTLSCSVPAFRPAETVRSDVADASGVPCLPLPHFNTTARLLLCTSVLHHLITSLKVKLAAVMFHFTCWSF